MQTEELTYNSYLIRINSVPEGQFEGSSGFGWGYEVRDIANRTLRFRLVLKSFDSERENALILQLKDWGMNQVHSRVDSEQFEPREICYEWEPGWANLNEVDCAEITPPQFRSPFL